MSLKGCLKQGHVSEAVSVFRCFVFSALCCVALRLFALCCVLFGTIYDTHVKDTPQGP